MNGLKIDLYNSMQSDFALLQARSRDWAFCRLYPSRLANGLEDIYLLNMNGFGYVRRLGGSAVVTAMAIVGWILAVIILVRPSENALYGQKAEASVNVPFDIARYGYKREQLTEALIESLGIRLIDQYSGELGVGVVSVTKESAEHSGDWWIAEYRQSLAGVPIDLSEIRFIVGSGGRIVQFKSTTYSNVACSTNPSIAGYEALEIAEQDIGGAAWSVWRNPRLMILPMRCRPNAEYTYRLVWRMTIDRTDNRAPVLTYLVDALNGGILQKRNLTQY